MKEVNSAANQMGRVRKLSESYGGGGWDMTLRDFKRQGDWEYVSSFGAFAYFFWSSRK